jgi:hypothetical protein
MKTPNFFKLLILSALFPWDSNFWSKSFLFFKEALVTLLGALLIPTTKQWGYLLSLVFS